jgi:Tol biopolymer transport system component
VLFASARDDVRRIFELELARGGPRAVAEDSLGFPRSLSADGDLIFFDRAGDGATREDIGVFSREEGSTTMILASAASERYPALSPDGGWLAYQSDATGRAEIYVQPVPDFDATHQVSSEGGSFPVWGATGDRLYYRRGPALVVVVIDTSEGFAVGAPEVLIESPFDVENHHFDVARDGEHFRVLRPAVRGVEELIVVEGWFAELERLAPAG